MPLDKRTLKIASPLKKIALLEQEQQRYTLEQKRKREAEARKITEARDADKRDRQDALTLLTDEHGLATFAAIDKEIEELRDAAAKLMERGFSKELCAYLASGLKIKGKKFDDLDLFIEGRVSFAKQIMGRKASLAAISREVMKHFPNKSADAVRQRVKRALRDRKNEPVQRRPLPSLS